MWNRTICTRTLGIALAIALAFVSTDALPGTGGAGKITYMKGTVQAHRNGAWTPLSKGSKVLGGDVIRTMKKSRVEIVLADESVIRLGSKSKVTIKKALFKKSGQKNYAVSAPERTSANERDKEHGRHEAG